MIVRIPGVTSCSFISFVINFFKACFPNVKSQFAKKDIYSLAHSKAEFVYLITFKNGLFNEAKATVLVMFSRLTVLFRIQNAYASNIWPSRFAFRANGSVEKNLGISFLLTVILNDDTRHCHWLLLYPRFSTILEGLNYKDASGVSDSWWRYIVLLSKEWGLVIH